MINEKKYSGKALESEVSISETETIAPYIPSEELIEVVELMRILKRPLLITGEPGCGKTRLAQAVAYELYGNDYRKHYFEWFVKSTTKAVDGLYKFNYLKKLQDSNQNQIEEKDELKAYVDYGPLGKAFMASTANEPSILLIDEVDKADIDFPNDLLLELDQKKFIITETRKEKTIEAKYPPIVFITSNDEKDLPNAFLRRCLFHYINFPNPETLQTIVQKHLATTVYNNKHITSNLIKQIVDRFIKERDEMQKNTNIDKIPSTSELLDWAKLIYHQFAYDGSDLETIKLPEKLMYPQALLKTYNDYLLRYGNKS